MALIPHRAPCSTPHRFGLAAITLGSTAEKPKQIETALIIQETSNGLDKHISYQSIHLCRIAIGQTAIARLYAHCVMKGEAEGR
jgi:hypothetical protein